MSFFVKACVAALKEFPAVNAEIDGDEIIYKHFVHMGIAVGGPLGPGRAGAAQRRHAWASPRSRSASAISAAARATAR